jgi:hypothetical protein
MSGAPTLDDEPGRFVVFLFLPATKTEPAYRHRLGGYHSADRAREAIAADKAAVDTTWADVLPISRRARQYAIWKAREWERVE